VREAHEKSTFQTGSYQGECWVASIVPLKSCETPVMSRLRSLQSYLLTRILLAPLMVVTITTIVYYLMRSLGGNPARAELGNKITPEQEAAILERIGWNKPVWVYLGNLAHFELGDSISNKKPVWDVIQEHFPATAELALYSMAIALLIGVVVGLISGSKPGTYLDLAGRLFGIITYSIPLFWIGMVLVVIFGVELRWFPTDGRFLGSVPFARMTGLYTVDSLLSGDFKAFGTAVHHLVLPCVSLGVVLSGIFERIVRVNLRQTLQSDYVEAARARGIPERRVLLSHAFKNALIPVVTVFGLTFSALLGGAVLTEVTFRWPGLGKILFDAISARDFPLVQGILVFFAIIIVLASIVIDLVNAYIDPRIRY
jgi:peptide/nickel transport system permease protein